MRFRKYIFVCIPFTQLINHTSENLHETLLNLLVYDEDGHCAHLELMRMYVLKERELYTQLNHLKMQGSLFIGDLWIPTQKVMEVEQLLQSQTKANQPSG